jgi:minichromosome maintenance protein 10
MLDDEFDDLEQLLRIEEELTREQNSEVQPPVVKAIMEQKAAESTSSQATETQPVHTKPKKLTFIDLMMTKSNIEAKPSTSVDKKSAIHNGDTDSDDDEDVRNFLERKFNEYGANINKNLKMKVDEAKDRQISAEVNRKAPPPTVLSNNFSKKAVPTPSTLEQKQKKPAQPMINNPAMSYNVYRDPVFGLRMIKPLVSSTVLVERMEGRTSVSMHSMRAHTERGDLAKDWVVAGVIISKSPSKTSQKGAQYIVWKVSDLRGDIKSVSVFLFKNAFKDLWKTPVGTCVGILNPGVMDRKDEKNEEAVLSVDNAQKVMVLGQSKDFGTCRSKKKNGEPCTAIVNLEECEYCIYHIKTEYSNASKRSELVSATAGRGLNDLRNKVLGKNEVFYAGNMYAAVPAKKNPKQVAKDNKRIASLSEHMRTSTELPSYRVQPVLPGKKEIFTDLTTGRKFTAPTLEVSAKQREQDLKRLKLLRGEDISSSTENLPSTSSAPVVVGPKKPALTFSTTPRLSQGNFTVDLNISGRKMYAAKQKALDILKKKPMEKSNPNFIKYRGTEAGKKRVLDELGPEGCEATQKKSKLDEDELEKVRKARILKIMNEKSIHSDLVEGETFVFWW